MRSTSLLRTAPPRPAPPRAMPPRTPPHAPRRAAADSSRTRRVAADSSPACPDAAVDFAVALVDSVPREIDGIELRKGKASS
nr:unnamed protein product [Digitaria exilis]